MPQIYHPEAFEGYRAETFSMPALTAFFESAPFDVKAIKITTVKYPIKLGREVGFSGWQSQHAVVPGTKDGKIWTQSMDGRSSDYISVEGLTSVEEVKAALDYIAQFEDLAALKTTLSLSSASSMF